MTPAAAKPDLAASWQRAWLAVGARANPALGGQLMRCYAEPQRAYHTLQHLEECIAALQPVLPLAAHAGEVEVALWFHDAIYDVRGHDNEARSADWAAQAMCVDGAAPAAADRVRALVLATRHAVLPVTPDAQLLVDIDLAILGAAEARFDDYERQVRREYAWVPEDLFRDKRREVLEQFLLRPAIYSTTTFRQRLESAARRNLARSIARLRA
jgi:predicted metal-dependent HD superfamily phosphohydrolase